MDIAADNDRQLGTQVSSTDIAADNDRPPPACPPGTPVCPMGTTAGGHAAGPPPAAGPPATQVGPPHGAAPGTQVGAGGAPAPLVGAARAVPSAAEVAAMVHCGAMFGRGAGLYHPRVPPELDGLTFGEQSVICRIQPIVAIKMIARGKAAMTGTACYVERCDEIGELATTLPRLAADVAVVIVERRQAGFKADGRARYRELEIRVARVEVALRWLILNSPAYADVKIDAAALEALGRSEYLDVPTIDGGDDVAVHSAASVVGVAPAQSRPGAGSASEAAEIPRPGAAAVLHDGHCGRVPLARSAACVGRGQPHVLVDGDGEAGRVGAALIANSLAYDDVVIADST